MKRHVIAAALMLVSAPVFAQNGFLATANDAPDPGAPLEYAVRNNEVRAGAVVIFDPGTATINFSSERCLQTIRKYLADKPFISKLRIESHTVCGKGDQALSEARAKAVADWLIAHGVDCARLVPAGFGCNKPILTDHAELNERIEFVNAALRGKLIGGMPADGGGTAVALSCP